MEDKQASRRWCLEFRQNFRQVPGRLPGLSGLQEGRAAVTQAEFRKLNS